MSLFFRRAWLRTFLWNNAAIRNNPKFVKNPNGKSICEKLCEFFIRDRLNPLKTNVRSKKKSSVFYLIFRELLRCHILLSEHRCIPVYISPGWRQRVGFDVVEEGWRWERGIPPRGLQLQGRSVVDSDERGEGTRGLWTEGRDRVVGSGGWGKTAPTPVYRPGYTLSRRSRKFPSLPALSRHPLSATRFLSTVHRAVECITRSSFGVSGRET